jgi:hypothetical protein
LKVQLTGLGLKGVYLGVALHFERALSVLTEINYRSKDNPGPNATEHHPQEAISNMRTMVQGIRDFRQARYMRGQ